MKKKGIEIKEEWIRPEVITFKIPNTILENLGIPKPLSKSGTFNNTFDNSMNKSSCQGRRSNS